VDELDDKNQISGKVMEKAGAIVLNRKDDAIALVFRKKHNDWSFPKGHLKRGEKAIDCARREVWEETGLSVHELVPLPTLTYINRLGQIINVAMFLARTSDDEPRPENWDDKVEFVPFREVIDRLSYDNLKKYYSKVRNAIRRYKRGLETS